MENALHSASVEAATLKLNFLANDPVDSFNSCPVAASTDAGSVESLNFEFLRQTYISLKFVFRDEKTFTASGSV